MTHVDTVIIGHGLAGATLAWTLRGAGQQVLVVDPNQQSGASHVSAGLITPRSGPKLTLSWGWESAWPRAEKFYRSVEQQTGTCLLRTVPAVRLCSSEEQFITCWTKANSKTDSPQIRQADPSVNPEWFHHAERAIEQPNAAQLNVQKYLETSRLSLVDDQAFRTDILDEANDVEFRPDAVYFPRLKLTADRVISCQGYLPYDGLWFNAVRFNPAKGEILRIQTTATVTESRVIHNGIWLAPAGERTFHVGSTFEWSQLDSTPTKSARDELVSKLNEVIRFPYSIVDQVARVRPTMRDFRPVIGFHPDEPRLGILNGLGTKGSLWAPWMAELLNDAIVSGASIPAELDVRRWFR